MTRDEMIKLAERIERHYDFACTGGPLSMCVEWQQLLAAPAAPAPVAAPAPIGESPLAHAVVEATARAHGWDAESDTLDGWLHARLSVAAPAPVAPPAEEQAELAHLETDHGAPPAVAGGDAGWYCRACDHWHCGDKFGNICVGCDCAARRQAGGDAPPEIQVGDVVVSGCDDNAWRVDPDDVEWCGRNAHKVLAVYREPLWRRRQEGQ